MKDDIKNKFIVDEDHNKERIEEVAGKTLRFGRVTKDGNIVIDDKGLTQDDILKLCLVIRYIAHGLDDSISQSVRPVELTKVLHERMESVGSRLSKLAKDGFAKKAGHGLYSVYPYKIEPFLSQLELVGEGQNEKTITKKRRKSGTSTVRKVKELTGVGLDIQKLIDDGFFNTPWFVNEVDTELKKETKYHDPKVIDMTIRKTFVSNRRTLKRIPNTEGGKAKWKYVIR